MTGERDVAALLAEIRPIGRDDVTGGYSRFVWGKAELALRRWFTRSAERLGLEVETDSAGNLWAWWGRGLPGRAFVTGSHLDSVPGGGGYDGPLGVASALAAVARLRSAGFEPARPVALVVFSEEEGGRFGVACAGSRLLTGLLDPHRALRLLDPDGISQEQAMGAAGFDPGRLAADPARVESIGEFVEVHIEQGHAATRAEAGHPSAPGLAAAGVPLGMATEIVAHGRWRFEIPGEADHAGTTAMADRRDPMPRFARAILAARTTAVDTGALATIGRAEVEPGAVNAIPSTARFWLDARGEEPAVARVVAEVSRAAGVEGVCESWTPATRFDEALTGVCRAVIAEELGLRVPLLPCGAGHDAGVLAQAGVRTAMIFVRNPSGTSHAPREHAEDADCERGVDALAAVMRAMTGRAEAAR